MDLSWTDEQLEIKDAIVEFARNELNRGIIDDDRSSTFPREKWQKCADFGLLGLVTAEEYGGRGLDPLTAMLAMEALGYGCRDNGLIFSINAQVWSVQTAIERFGSETQKGSFLRRLVSGEIRAAHGMTEPGTGSDTFALSTRARRDGDGYVLDGSKIFITNAPFADLFLVFATAAPSRGFFGITAFLVERDTPGLSISQPIEKMGLRTSPLGEIGLQECRVGVESRLGKEGNGGVIFNRSMEWERGFILASCVGTMQRQLEECIEYARTREQFGQPIGKFQAVSHRIVDMKIRLETSRSLMYRLGWLRATGESTDQEAAMVKLYLSECFVQSCLDAVHLHGGYGYTTEGQVERDLRDSVAARIYSGTSEMQREIIAASLGL